MSFVRAPRNVVRLFVCGDVMLGRGVDQSLKHSVSPELYEDYMKDARDYLQLCIRQNGALPPAPRPVSYVWGDAIDVFNAMKPHLRIINLETAITDRGKPCLQKGVHYRMHPLNVDVIRSASVDCCVLGNNHVLDWGIDGLHDTLAALKNAQIAFVGAGENARDVRQPCVFSLPSDETTGETSRDSRVLVFSISCPTAGVLTDWNATERRPGVWYVDTTSPSDAAREVSAVICSHKRSPSDIVVLSVHWGSNWGWQLDDGSVTFAETLIDNGVVDFVFGHSSHHIRPVRMRNGRLIATGCGDFLSDYEGIHGDPRTASFRDDLSLMYFVDLDRKTGVLVDLLLVPMKLKQLRLWKLEIGDPDEKWLFENMAVQCARFGVSLRRQIDQQTKLLAYRMDFDGTMDSRTSPPPRAPTHEHKAAAGCRW